MTWYNYNAPLSVVHEPLADVSASASLLACVGVSFLFFSLHHCVLFVLVLGDQIPDILISFLELISSMPSPLYQCKNALRLYMTPNCCANRWKIPFKAVVFAMNVQLWPSFGAISTTEVLRLLGIHS